MISYIRGHDFPALESLSLPKGVNGGTNYEFRLISDVPEFIQAIHLLLHRTPDLFDKFWLSSAFNWMLSEGSPDWYDWDEESGRPDPPFCLQIIQAGPRRGWSWCTFHGPDNDIVSCEINWLDPEPDKESSGYEDYRRKLSDLQEEISLYRGYYQKPTEDEYNQLCFADEGGFIEAGRRRRCTKLLIIVC